MLPVLDYKRIILAILLVIVSISLLVGIIWLMFIRTPGGEVINPGAGTPGSGGVLPGVGSGQPGGVVGPGGNLPSDETPGGESGGGGQIEINETAQGGLTQVTGLVDERMNEVDLHAGGLNYLSGEDDKFYRISSDGSKVLLSQKEFPNVSETTWSPDGEKVIMEFPDGANIIYDFTKNKQVTLPTGAEDLIFDPSSEEIAYKFLGSREEDNWLVVSDINNSGAEAVEPLGDQEHNVQVSWSPDRRVVAMYHEPIGLNREEVFFVGLNEENFKSMVVEGSNFEGVWSPDGSKILYHVINAGNGYNPMLWVADAGVNSIGNNNFNLGLTTFVDKCVFSSDTKVYCAVPASLPEGSGLYRDLLNDSADAIYEINLNSGIINLIAYPVLSEELLEFQVRKLFVTENSDKLYFWDNWTEKVYYMKLK